MKTATQNNPTNNPTNNLYTSGEWTISWDRKDEKWRGFAIRNSYTSFRIVNLQATHECSATIALIDDDGTVEPNLDYDYDGIGYSKIPEEMPASVMEAIKRLAKEHKQDLSA